MANEKQSVTGNAIDRRIIRRLLTYVAPFRGMFFLALGLTILTAILAPLRPVLVQYTLDNPVMRGDIPGLRFMILALVGLLVLEAVVMYATTFLTNWLGQNIIKDIREQVFNHILKLRLAFFDRTPIGTLQTRTISDVETLNDVFTSGLVRILGQLLQLFAILAAMLYTSWKLSLAVLVTIPLLLFATYVFKNKVKVAFQNVRKSVSEMNAFMQEHLSGMMIIHIFNREKEELSRYDKINQRLRKAHINSVMYYSVFYPVVEIITALGLAVLVWFGAGQVMQGGLRFGELVAFVMFVQMFFRPIRLLADQFNILQMGMVSAERIFTILDNDQIIPDEGKQTDLPGRADQIGIRFKNVRFAYVDETWVLKDINLDIEPGHKVALVGSTGSGKSTVINLLSRFYDIQGGEIEINGVDVREYSLQFVRSLIGVVLQDVFLFSGSIHDNITLNNPDIPREKVIEAAKQVGAHDFISRLPGDYDYEVRERGATLSLGQRQLIAFARVMTYDPRILVLDEATANIDTESEEIIQEAVRTVMKGRTSIIIAHRLSTIQEADQIIVLQQGEIQEAGRHQELLALEGLYYDLHQKQIA
ncbi:MAG: ABC transporter ATP-binding protein [Bacteroidota bacterium]